MANSKISSLTATTSLADTDMVPVATAAGATKKITGSNLKKASFSSYRMLRTGRYMAVDPWPLSLATSTATLVVNRLLIIPFTIAQAGSVDRIAVEVTSGGTAGAVLRMGILSDPGASIASPLPVVIDAGTVASTGTGVAEITIAATPLVAGVNWVGIVAQTAACTVRAIKNPGSLDGSGAIGAADASNSHNATALYNGDSFSGALGSSVTPSGTVLGLQPLVFLRAV